MNPKVAIIGAGISGLCVAFFLKRAGIQALVLEAEEDVGGTMRSRRIGGYLVELGPNSALETTPLFQELIADLGLVQERVYANEAAKNRYIFRAGELHPLPMSPLAFLRSRLWSWRGKLRLLAEPFHGRAAVEESVADFVRRRVGEEFLDYAVNPFVAGIYAGDPERLSVRFAFPRLHALEERYGGLILGLLRGARERRRRPESSKIAARMFSFREGMGTLPRAVAAALGEAVWCATRALSVSRIGAGFEIAFERDGRRDVLRAERVVLATPAYAAASLIESFAPEAARALRRIVYPPVSAVILGYPEVAIGRSLDGFGFLVPEKERRRILGTIWNSAIFPDRAPRGSVALTTFVGGMRQPELARRRDEELIELTSEELSEILRIRGAPEFAYVSRWERAIPQYELGYGEILATLERAEREHAGLYFCANYRGGIAVGDCLKSAHEMAQRILRDDARL
ncbi:MAG: protoporphyrinogen oxidase [Blastocatellia bacterium]|nr:protoporphyrinogen oxidase [Blastocatellia bacterium]MCS7156184.1 protoporphyrinogen oxidase [Blastocatellia bacterium]MCX7751466.1 protoporphyrinogen oxidase [Blastocatellia bacterium]MDW8169179.1 protoporphyrinogen oxidase [Acidobacteriota bacterium]MDW8256040.1 protoporphyrinogen oxidase [Acidobacteriota bacterium]